NEAPDEKEAGQQAQRLGIVGRSGARWSLAGGAGTMSRHGPPQLCRRRADADIGSRYLSEYILAPASHIKSGARSMRSRQSRIHRLGSSLALTALAAACSGSAGAGTATRSMLGKLQDGTAIEAVTLTNGKGVRARIITYGATLQALEAPDKKGRTADIVLGYDDLRSYVEKPNYFGATIGRYANRIAGGTFALDGHTYRLSRNDKTNSLHGGAVGFDKRVWKIDTLGSAPLAAVTFALTSAAGDQGYPGKLEVKVRYALDESNALTIDYTAATDAPTV